MKPNRWKRADGSATIDTLIVIWRSAGPSTHAAVAAAARLALEVERLRKVNRVLRRKLRAA